MIMSAVPLLDIRGIQAFYGDFQALFDISMRIELGEIVAIIGSNGAGKSTLLKAIVGMLQPKQGRVTFAGDSIERLAAHHIVAKGITMVPEGRRLFSSLTVEENLVIGSTVARKGPWNLSRVYRMFPVLEECKAMPATALSGGQQQMVAIGRALMSNPKLLLCDEISLGLAPTVIRDIYRQLPPIVGEGTSLVIVEQDIVQALKAAQRVYCLQEGRIALEADTATVTRENISAAYFGI
jgi:branched-chain amino acid transport system ATP-binding protein